MSSDLGLHECDLVWADHRLIVELDGDAAHGTRSQRRRDSRIANALARAGWHVIRISGHELATAPDDVLATIRAALARAEGPARGTSATK